MYSKRLPAEYDHQKYMQITEKCLIDILLDRADAKKVHQSLMFDFRKEKGMHGRVIAASLIVFDYRTKRHTVLLKFDRLEVSGCCPDIHADFSAWITGTFPFRLVFWRKDSSVDFSFRSPLLQFLQVEHLMIDDLHTLDLGPAARLGGHVASEAVRIGVLYGNDVSETGIKQGCRMLSREFRTWRRGRTWTGLNKITVGLIGVSSNKSGGHLQCKANEARSFLPFALHLAHKLSPHLCEKGPHLVRAVKSLLDCYAMMREPHASFDSDRFGDSLDQCLESSKSAGVKLLHKFHLMRHFRSLTKRAGNPSRFSAYADETKNNETIKLALRASTPNFGPRILMRDYMQFHA